MNLINVPKQYFETDTSTKNLGSNDYFLVDVLKYHKKKINS